MLGVNKYPKEYIDSCRKKVEIQLHEYDNLVAHCGKASIAIESFSDQFFNNLVVLLDAFFVHRLRSMEGKDGNPLNEVRVLCNSILANDNKMMMDKGIKLVPEKSLLKFKADDEINISRDQFSRLADAFFSEIEKKYLA